MNKKAKKNTEIMLTTAIKGGRPGDVVSVSPGYARNRLIPKGWAIRVQGNQNTINKKMEEWKKRDEEQRLIANNYAEKLKDIFIEIKTESGVGNTLYGSITANKISKILEEDYNINISKNDIIMDPIKLLGQYKVKVNLYGGQTIEMQVSVLPIG